MIFKLNNPILMVIYTVISNRGLMEPQDLVDYLEEALGRSYHKGEAIVGIILAGMGKDPDCLTSRDCNQLLVSVEPFIKNPRDLEHIRTLVAGGRAPGVNAYTATNARKRGPQTG
jgi:hypothetical protein